MRTVAAVTLVLLLLSPMTAVSDQLLYEPYDPLEFPQWSHDLRRGSIIFLGSTPITFGVTSLVLPLMYQGEVPGSTRLITALSLSAGIAALDWLLGRIGE